MDTKSETPTRLESTCEECGTELSPYGSWVCECADTSCVRSIEMTLGEYE
jgi:hypothetical protein